MRFFFPGAYLLTSPYVEWRCPSQPVYSTVYATYVQNLTWFFDSPSTPCPFSVHRMALARKELGKDVGQWFGPSTAAGAIKCVDVIIIARCMLTFLSDRWCKAFPQHRSASRSRWTSRSSRRMCIRHHIRPSNLPLPQTIEMGRCVWLSYSSVFGLE